MIEIVFYFTTTLIICSAVSLFAVVKSGKEAEEGLRKGKCHVY